MALIPLSPNTNLAFISQSPNNNLATILATVLQSPNNNLALIPLRLALFYKAQILIWHLFHKSQIIILATIFLKAQMINLTQFYKI